MTPADTSRWNPSASRNCGFSNDDGGSSHSPTDFIARGISGFRMNHFHRFPDRRFSALSNVIPVSNPKTSAEAQPFVGWKASVKAVAAVDLVAELLLHGLQSREADVRRQHQRAGRGAR